MVDRVHHSVNIEASLVYGNDLVPVAVHLGCLNANVLVSASYLAKKRASLVDEHKKLAAAKAEIERERAELSRLRAEAEKPSPWEALKKLPPKERYREALKLVEMDPDDETIAEVVARDAYARSKSGKADPKNKQYAEQVAEKRALETELAELRKQVADIGNEFKTRDQRAEAERFQTQYLDTAVKAIPAETFLSQLHTANPAKARNALLSIGQQLERDLGETPSHAEVIAEYEKRRRDADVLAAGTAVPAFPENEPSASASPSSSGSPSASAAPSASAGPVPIGSASGVVEPGSSATPGRQTIVDDPAKSPYPVWDPTTPYPANVKVVWQQQVYQAKRWTTGFAPDTQVAKPEETPWRLIGPVAAGGESPVPLPSVSAGTYPEWDPNIDYPTGSRVQFQNVPYVAKWANKGKQPDPVGGNKHPWAVLLE